jgi:hypothetical protein
VWCDERWLDVVLVVAGASVLVATALLARGGAYRWEAVIFHAINGLPNGIRQGVWVLNQQEAAHGQIMRLAEPRPKSSATGRTFCEAADTAASLFQPLEPCLFSRDQSTVGPRWKQSNSRAIRCIDEPSSTS